MKIFTPEQVRDWDRYTIDHEPVSSVQLMDRAGTRAAEWIIRHISPLQTVQVFCGGGNNGGDGLVIARRLQENGINTEVYLLELGRPLSPDCAHQLARFSTQSSQLQRLTDASGFPAIEPGTLVVDALLGSGLNRSLEGVTAELVDHLNQHAATIVSIDQPSGLLPQTSVAIHATHTLSFQTWKLPFFYPENDRFTGTVHILDIQLHDRFAAQTSARFETNGLEEARGWLQQRPRSAHKGMLGHAALLAGSWGMLGAAALATEACLRSGAGKVSSLQTEKNYPLLQPLVPEAIFRIENGDDYVTETGFLGNFQAIGLGPGCGVHPEQVPLAASIFRLGVPLVLDADALNLMTAFPELQARIPENTILTPHPREFDGMTHKHTHTADRWETAMQKAMAWKSFIVLKGHHTLVATPNGKGYVNLSGNAGMATAGSGDVLTGLITGLRAQGYPPLAAACLGVFLHGLSGDLAAAEMGQEAMLARDIMRMIGQAWKILRSDR